MHLSLQSLSCRRGGRLVFDRISADLGPGAALMVRGPNGSGKSSLLRILAGFLPAAGGRVRWREEDSGGWHEEGLESRAAYLAHANGLKPQLTVAENLRFWTTLSGTARYDPHAALGIMGLSALEDMQSGLLSAGQQRRLALCRLPQSGRKLWLLDEPETALDTASRTALSGMILDHLRSGGLAIVASHGMADIPGSTTLSLECAPHAEVRA